MWRELWRALRGTDALAEMTAGLGEMLDIGRWMFEQASRVLARSANWNELADKLYAEDRRINQTERRIRERIVAHLTTTGSADLAPCLVLMSVVKDAERIGDYCKNIFEVGKLYTREYTHPEFANPLDEIRTGVLPLFAQAKQAFMSGDRSLANEVLTKADTYVQNCEQIVRQLLSVHESIAPDEAVAYVLLARFYKRVAAHLSNIATSVVSPVPMLDFKPGKKNNDP